MYHPTPIGGTHTLFLLYQSTTCSGVDRSQNVIMYHPTPIGANHAFRLLYINQLPVVEWIVPKNVTLYHPTPIGGTRTFFLLYQSTACSGVDRTQKCYYVSSNANRGDSNFFFSYINQLPVVECIVPKNVVMYHPTPIGVTRTLFLLYQSTACCGVDRTQNVIKYHPKPIGANHAFRLLYINQLPGVEWSAPKIYYYVSSNADWSDSRGVYPKFTSQTPLPVQIVHRSIILHILHPIQ
jgi:hypothetical protein